MYPYIYMSGASVLSYIYIYIYIYGEYRKTKYSKSDEFIMKESQR